MSSLRSTGLGFQSVMLRLHLDRMWRLTWLYGLMRNTKQFISTRRFVYIWKVNGQTPDEVVPRSWSSRLELISASKAIRKSVWKNNCSKWMSFYWLTTTALRIAPCSHQGSSLRTLIFLLLGWVFYHCQSKNPNEQNNPDVRYTA